MVDIDFISGKKADPNSTSSYDAIAIRFKEAWDEEQKVVVIDGGFADTGNDIVNFIADTYGATKIDLMISTHPDTDHLNGLLTIIQQVEVGELLIHQPRTYRSDLEGFGNLDNLDSLLGYAAEQGTIVSDSYTGLSRFDDRLVILGPTEEYYKQLLHEQLDPAGKMAYSLRKALSEASVALKDLGRALHVLPEETLGNNGVTSPRNNSSVVTLLNLAGRRLLFTGDTGIDALSQAADQYELRHGAFSTAPLHFFQAPHHGSRRNLGSALLDRIFGEVGAHHSDSHTVFIHAAKASKKHPSPKVTNALLRRGARQEKLGTTEGKSIWFNIDSEPRQGYSSINPYPILPEDEA